MTDKIRIPSGVSHLDRLLGGLFIGDNVVWLDESGSLASVFYLNFIQASQAQNKQFVYVSFDRSPRNLLEKLDALAEYPMLTILDCFTCGKGARSSVFMKFYETSASQWPCNIIRVDEPGDVNKFMDALYGVHAKMTGDVRLIFESISGMQELWGGEEHILSFYSHSCPRLYELNTIAYWIMEKHAHSPRLRANITQIAQVSMDLTIKRGSTFLTILKAENRSIEDLQQPHRYWTKDLNVVFEEESRTTGRIDLGLRVKDIRIRRGLSQKDLAKLIGVTPSTISQVESNFVYPSLPSLLKMAEVLSVDVCSLIQEKESPKNRVIFPAAGAVDVKFPGLPNGSVSGRLLTPADLDARAEPYLIEIPPGRHVPCHFFVHKGEEMGYVLSGKLQVKLERAMYTLRAGDIMYLTSDMPTEWANAGTGVARLLWIKIK